MRVEKNRQAHNEPHIARTEHEDARGGEQVNAPAFGKELLIPGYAAVDYWQALRRADGPRLGDYTRLFMVPGMWHCSGGPGANVFGAQGQVAPPRPGDSNDDALAALADWVETGTAPRTIIATKYVHDLPAQGIAFQRPLCEYPRHAAYQGSGDPNESASFACVPNETAHILAPAPVYGP